MNLYRSESSNPKWNAQRNLTGRTHYVDDDSLRFHKSRILSARHTDSGLLFAIVESVGLDYHNSKRGCRYVIFDIFGNVVSRVGLEECWKRSEQATKAMWHALNAMNAHQITLDAIARQETSHAREMDYLRADLAKLSERAA